MKVGDIFTNKQGEEVEVKSILDGRITVYFRASKTTREYSHGIKIENLYDPYYPLFGHIGYKYFDSSFSTSDDSFIIWKGLIEEYNKTGVKPDDIKCYSDWVFNQKFKQVRR